MSIQKVSSDSAWNEFVFRSMDATVFHSSAWLNGSHCDFCRIGVFESGEMLAAIVLQVDGLGRGCLGSITPYLGPISRPDLSPDKRRAGFRLLAREVYSRMESPHFFSSPWCEDLQPFVLEGFQATLLYTFVLPLRGQGGWSQRSSGTLNRNLKAAKRDSLRAVSETDPSQLLRLVESSFQRQGITPWFSVAECESLMTAMAKRRQSRCFVTLDEAKRPIAAVGIVWDDRRAHYILGGYDAGRAHRGGTSLAMEAALNFCTEQLSVESFDMEGSFIPGVEAFMRGFGGDLIPFFFCKRATGPLIAQEAQ